MRANFIQYSHKYVTPAPLLPSFYSLPQFNLQQLRSPSLQNLAYIGSLKKGVTPTSFIDAETKALYCAAERGNSDIGIINEWSKSYPKNL